MKITLFISQLVKGGAERVVCNLANNLSNNNDVTIISEKIYPSAYEISSKVKVLNLDNRIEKSIFKKIYIRIKKLNLFLKKEQPDVMVCFLPEPCFLALFLKIFRKNKVIISVRNDPKVEYKKLVYKIAMKILYPLADGYVFQTEEAMKYFNKKIQKKSIIIPNPIDEKFISEPYTKNRNKEIVTVGRLNKQKNHALLIRAFKIFSEKYPDYKLIIYGDGTEKEMLINLIEKLELVNNVNLAGIVDDIKDKIKKATMFVLSSDFEGMPNSLMEALAIGVPCISTDCPCGGPKMLIDNYENGILVRVNDINDLSNKMIELAENVKLQKKFSINACKKINHNYNPKIINDMWQKYIYSIYNTFH